MDRTLYIYDIMGLIMSITVPVMSITLSSVFPMVLRVIL